MCTQHDSPASLSIEIESRTHFSLNLAGGLLSLSVYGAYLRRTAVSQTLKTVSDSCIGAGAQRYTRIVCLTLLCVERNHEPTYIPNTDMSLMVLRWRFFSTCETAKNESPNRHFHRTNDVEQLLCRPGDHRPLGCRRTSRLPFSSIITSSSTAISLSHRQIRIQLRPGGIRSRMALGMVVFESLA